MMSEGRGAITRAAEDYAAAGFTFPEEQAVQLQLLEHFDEARARSAIDTLTRLLQQQPVTKRPVLEQAACGAWRVYADEASTREGAGGHAAANVRFPTGFPPGGAGAGAAPGTAGHGPGASPAGGSAVPLVFRGGGDPARPRRGSGLRCSTHVPSWGVLPRVPRRGRPADGGARLSREAALLRGPRLPAHSPR
jgi:hypothetical protein